MIEEPVKLIQGSKRKPREHKAKVLIWLDLTVNDMDKIDEAVTTDQVKEVLAAIFQLRDFRDDLKTGILLDLYYYTINFARENRFSQEQTSAFFSIVKKTHEVCIETPFGNVDQCFNYFRELVLCHAVKRPPFSIDLFSAEEVRRITEYFINTYFRHYKMYKYVFTPLVRLDLSMSYVGIPDTPPPSEGEPDNEQAVEAEVAEDKTNGEEVAADLAKQTQDEIAANEDQDAPVPSPQKEESAAASELKQLIKAHLSEEIKSLRVSMETKLKESEEIMNKKLAALEGTPSAKGSRGSGKSRKK